MEEQTAKRKTQQKTETVEKVAYNPLKKEKVFVKFVPQKNGIAPDNPAHVLYGGMADGAFSTYCVPMLRSTGNYKNILTNEEKEFLENALGLDYNALSVYRKENNYWDGYKVRVPKEGLHLDLSDPEDYIKYKVLLANTEFIAPSVQELEDRHKATYRFVLAREEDTTNLENSKMDATMLSYKEFGKIENDLDTMRVLVELLDGRPFAANTPAEFLRSRINILIQADPKKFARQITDPMLHAKVLIRRGLELGKLTKRGDFYYLKSDNSPLCEAGEEPTLSIAARYINLPAHQDIKFILESEVGNAKGK